MKHTFYCFGLFFLFINFVNAQKTFKAGELSVKGGNIISYRYLQPKKVKRNKKYPLIIFLHGAGERGSDNKSQLIHGAKLFEKRSTRKKFPAYVVFPQCPAEDYWAATIKEKENKEDPFKFDFSLPPKESLKNVFELIKTYQNNPNVDTDRIYIMGLSMGGMGTFEAISRHPEWFAAAIPICGGGDLNFVPKFATKTKVWIFHGAKDDVVLPRYSRDMVQEIIFKGGFPKYTEFPEANHNSWDPAFETEGLLEWLFEQKRTTFINN